MTIRRSSNRKGLTWLKTNTDKVLPGEIFILISLNILLCVRPYGPVCLLLCMTTSKIHLYFTRAVYFSRATRAYPLHCFYSRATPTSRAYPLYLANSVNSHQIWMNFDTFFNSSLVNCDSDNFYLDAVHKGWKLLYCERSQS